MEIIRQTICRLQLACGSLRNRWSLIVWESIQLLAKAHKIHALMQPFASQQLIIARCEMGKKHRGVKMQRKLIHLHHAALTDHPADHIFIISHHVSLRLITCSPREMQLIFLFTGSCPNWFWNLIPNWERRAASDSQNWFVVSKLILLHSSWLIIKNHERSKKLKSWPHSRVACHGAVLNFGI